MRGERCDALAAFPAPLRRSLEVAAGGRRIAGVCRCTRPQGHDGAHQARFCAESGERGWIRWDEFGFHLGRAEAVDPARHAATAAPGTHPPGGAARHRRAEPAAGAGAEALWTMAASVQRLAETVTGAAERLARAIEGTQTGGHPPRR